MGGRARTFTDWAAFERVCDDVNGFQNRLEWKFDRGSAESRLGPFHPSLRVALGPLTAYVHVWFRNRGQRDGSDGRGGRDGLSETCLVLSSRTEALITTLPHLTSFIASTPALRHALTATHPRFAAHPQLLKSARALILITRN